MTVQSLLDAIRRRIYQDYDENEDICEVNKAYNKTVTQHWECLRMIKYHKLTVAEDVWNWILIVADKSHDRCKIWIS